ncbi:transposase [Amphibacillus cookii]|uniref:transposase n=1 Tax=Amphibacillus cookii TaxID=767787 RepID=UPI00195D888F|nr:transposase [Amphibacillus cookii]MBM7541489.1 transposase [Amphibacillus cookii]
MTRYRRRLGKHQTLLKVQYTRILERSFPELATYGQARHSAYMMRLLKKYPSPRKIVMAHEKTLVKLLGMKSIKPALFKQLARDSVRGYSSITAFELTQTIQQIDLYDTQIKEVDKKIQEMMDTLDSLIVTIPGISYRLGSIIIAEIGVIFNFQNPGQLLAFAGVQPSIYQSGNYQGKGKMVKRGSSQLRWAMYHASRLVSIYSPTFKTYMRKKASRGKAL